MDKKEWWQQSENEILPLDISLDEIVYLYGRETPDGWEYASVSLTGEEEHLNYTLKNGVQYNPDGTKETNGGIEAAENLRKEYLGRH